MTENKEDYAVVVYDNYSENNLISKLQTGWGFSLFVFINGRSILFDCGWSSKILFSNLKELDIPIDRFDDIIISHQHWDHMGALSDVVDLNPQSAVYIPKDFSRHLAGELDSRVKEVIHLDGQNGPYEINENLLITGGLKGKGPIEEQSALFKGSTMNLMVVGCMHPGLKPLYDNFKQKIEPNAVIGGFHFFSDAKFIKKTNLKHLYIGHCTKYPEVFENLEGFHFKKIHTGFRISL